jgi:hypothetical protein
MTRALRGLIFVTVAMLALPGAIVAETTVSPADAMQLLLAAGMSFEGGKVLNPCHHATAPRVRFLDLNGDGRAEAVTMDHDPACYGPDPGYQSKILMKDATGHWKVIGALLGVFKPLESRSYGWLDFTSGNGTCRPVFRSNSQSYVAVPGCGNGTVAKTAGPTAPVTPPPAPNDNLKLFPRTYGHFAPRGDCAELPRVTVSAQAIRIETAAGAADFTHPNVVPNYMGPQDESITYQLQGEGKGLAMSIEGNKLWSAGGDHLSAPERALSAVADVNRTPLRRCRN